MGWCVNYIRIVILQCRWATFANIFSRFFFSGGDRNRFGVKHFELFWNVSRASFAPHFWSHSRLLLARLVFFFRWKVSNSNLIVYFSLFSLHAFFFAPLRWCKDGKTNWVSAKESLYNMNEYYDYELMEWNNGMRLRPRQTINLEEICMSEKPREIEVKLAGHWLG